MVNPSQFIWVLQITNILWLCKGAAVEGNIDDSILSNLVNSEKHLKYDIVQVPIEIDTSLPVNSSSKGERALNNEVVKSITHDSDPHDFVEINHEYLILGSKVSIPNKDQNGVNGNTNKSKLALGSRFIQPKLFPDPLFNEIVRNPSIYPPKPYIFPTNKTPSLNEPINDQSMNNVIIHISNFSAQVNRNIGSLLAVLLDPTTSFDKITITGSNGVISIPKTHRRTPLESRKRFINRSKNMARKMAHQNRKMKPVHYDQLNPMIVNDNIYHIDDKIPLNQVLIKSITVPVSQEPLNKLVEDENSKPKAQVVEIKPHEMNDQNMPDINRDYVNKFQERLQQNVPTDLIEPQKITFAKDAPLVKKPDPIENNTPLNYVPISNKDTLRKTLTHQEHEALLHSLQKLINYEAMKDLALHNETFLVPGYKNYHDRIDFIDDHPNNITDDKFNNDLESSLNNEFKDYFYQTIDVNEHLGEDKNKVSKEVITDSMKHSEPTIPIDLDKELVYLPNHLTLSKDLKQQVQDYDLGNTFGGQGDDTIGLKRLKDVYRNLMMSKEDSLQRLNENSQSLRDKP